MALEDPAGQGVGVGGKGKTMFSLQVRIAALLPLPQGRTPHLLISIILSRPAHTAPSPVSYFHISITELNSCPPSPPSLSQARPRPTVHPIPKSPALSFLGEHNQPLLFPPSQQQSLHTMALCASHPQLIRLGLTVPGTQLTWAWLMCSEHWTLTAPFLLPHCYPQCHH